MLSYVELNLAMFLLQDVLVLRRQLACVLLESGLQNGLEVLLQGLGVYLLDVGVLFGRGQSPGVVGVSLKIRLIGYSSGAANGLERSLLPCCFHLGFLDLLSSQLKLGVSFAFG